MGTTTIQRTAGLAGGLALLAALPLLASVTNTYWDETATTGGLHTMCSTFSIDNDASFEAECNKRDGTTLALATASMDLSREIDAACGWLEVSAAATAVMLTYECPGRPPGPDAIDHEVDLNDWIQWDVDGGTLSWKS